MVAGTSCGCSSAMARIVAHSMLPERVLGKRATSSQVDRRCPPHLDHVIDVAHDEHIATLIELTIASAVAAGMFARR